MVISPGGGKGYLMFIEVKVRDFMDAIDEKKKEYMIRVLP
jgi:hypothetical protein